VRKNKKISIHKIALTVLLLFIISFIISIIFICNHIDHEHENYNVGVYKNCFLCLQIYKLKKLLNHFSAAAFVILSFLSLFFKFVFYNDAYVKTSFLTLVFLKVRMNN